MRRRRSRPRVLVYGFLGMGNLGNEASLEAFLDGLATVRPDAEVWCLGTGPEDVERRHGLRARRLTLGSSGQSRSLRALTRLADLPRTWWLLGGTEAAVVPGMGVFESTLGAANPFGLPYWLFVLALAARLRRRPLLFLSVGADRPHHRMTAFFFRHTVRLATYCSFRDQLSEEAAHELGGLHDRAPVHPDLAFGLPLPPDAGEPVPGRVVVGVMRFGPRDDPGVMAGYEAKVADVVSTLARSGDTVRLVVGDLADLAVADSIARRAGEVPGTDASRIEVSDADDQAGLMSEMSRAEVVVASRYHNVLAALRVGAPTVSLGYAGKNAALLDRFGLGPYDQPIDCFDPATVLRQVAEVRGTGRSAERRQVQLALEESLNRQYQAVAPLLGGAR